MPTSHTWWTHHVLDFTEPKALQGDDKDDDNDLDDDDYFDIDSDIDSDNNSDDEDLKGDINKELFSGRASMRLHLQLGISRTTGAWVQLQVKEKQVEAHHPQHPQRGGHQSRR